MEISKPGAAGIRVYFGLEKGEIRAYLVAVNEQGEDIPENVKGSPVGSDKPCPTYCP